MSQRKRRGAGARVDVTPVPVPRAVVRAAAAGEWVNAFDGGDVAIDIAQRGVGRGLVGKIIVYGLDEDGHEVDRAVVSFESDSSGDIDIDLEQGAISGLDAGLARSVRVAADRMRRQRLRPSVYFLLADEVLADPERAAAARAELGLGSAPVPQCRPGYSVREVLNVTPGKDKGLRASFFRRFKE